MKTFKASMNRDTKILTAVVFTIILFAIICPVFFKKENGWEVLISSAVLLPVIVVAFLLRPTGYTVDDAFLIINKDIGEKRVRLSGITDVQEVTKADTGFGIRTFGVGGFFGYYGKFYYNKIGGVTAYVTNPDKLILIKTNEDKKYLVSPDEMLEFITEIKQRMSENRFEK